MRERARCQEGDETVLCDKVSGGLVDLVFKPVENIRGVGLIRGWFEDPLNDFVARFCGGGELVDEEAAAQIEQEEEDNHVEQRCNSERDLSRALAQPWVPGAMDAIEKARGPRRGHGGPANAALLRGHAT